MKGRFALRCKEPFICLDFRHLTSVFVKGRTLDVFAREPLWKVGLDYRHGTGHGIGHFLNVHEGINTQAVVTDTVFTLAPELI